MCRHAQWHSTPQQDGARFESAPATGVVTAVALAPHLEGIQGTETAAGTRAAISSTGTLVLHHYRE